MKELKRESTLWIKRRARETTDFNWQTGYGAFSISPGDVELVTAYIANQEEHHREISFQDEFRRILQKYGLEWDERYLWD